MDNFFKCKIACLLIVGFYTQGCTTTTYNAGVKGTFLPQNAMVVEATGDYGVFYDQADKPVFTFMMNTSLGYDIFGKGVWYRPIGFQLGYFFKAGDVYVPLELVANPLILDFTPRTAHDIKWHGDGVRQNISIALMSGLFVPIGETNGGINGRIGPVLVWRDIDRGDAPSIGFTYDFGWRQIVEYESTQQ